MLLDNGLALTAAAQVVSEVTRSLVEDGEDGGGLPRPAGRLPGDGALVARIAYSQGFVNFTAQQQEFYVFRGDDE